MAGKYREGAVKHINQSAGEVFLYETTPCVEFIAKQLRAYQYAFGKSRETDAGIADVLSIADCCNQMVDREAPWKLAKDPAQAERLDAVLYTLAESLRIIAILLYPVLPRAAHGIFDQLGWKLAESGRSQRFHLDHAVWAHPEHGLPDGHVLGQPTPLFPRLEPTPE
jgi:methionyl-tRNA synthetase